MIARFDPDICGVCARRAGPCGYNDHGKPDILWVCDDPACLKTAQRTYRMKQDNFTGIEQDAARRGGEAGGQYLDTIGVTDLATLSEPQWNEFVRTIIRGYRKALKAGVEAGAKVVTLPPRRGPNVVNMRGPGR